MGGIFFAKLPGTVQNIVFFQHFKHTGRRRTGHRITGISPTQATGHQGIHHIFGPRDRRQRKTTANTLAHHDNIGADIGMFDGKHLTRPAKARLDFISDQNHAIGITKTAQFDKKGRVARPKTALALHRFDHHGTDASGVNR